MKSLEVETEHRRDSHKAGNPKVPIHTEVLEETFVVEKGRHSARALPVRPIPVRER